MCFHDLLSFEKHGWIIQGTISDSVIVHFGQHSSDYAIANRSYAGSKQSINLGPKSARNSAYTIKCLAQIIAERLKLAKLEPSELDDQNHLLAVGR